MQKKRREMLRDHTFPKEFIARFQQLDTLLNEKNCWVFVGYSRTGVTDIKPLLLQSCANVFMAYFCSVKFSSDDEDFMKMVRNLDEIFFEVNQGYAADFLPCSTFTIAFKKFNKIVKMVT